MGRETGGGGQEVLRRTYTYRFSRKPTATMTETTKTGKREAEEKKKPPRQQINVVPQPPPQFVYTYFAYSRESRVRNELHRAQTVVRWQRRFRRLSIRGCRVTMLHALMNGVQKNTTTTVIFVPRIIYYTHVRVIRVREGEGDTTILSTEEERCMYIHV